MKSLFILLLATVLNLSSKPVYASGDPVTLSDTLKASGISKLEISGLRGMKVMARGYDGANVIYAWTVTGSGAAFEEIIKNSAVDAKSENGLLVISVTTPGSKESKGIHSDSDESWLKQLIGPSKSSKNKSFDSKEISQTFEIFIPRNIAVILSSGISEITADKLQSGLTIRNRAGTVETSRTGGVLDIENRYGKIVVRENQGNVQILGKSGRVEVEDVAGRLTIDSDYSTISVSRHTGDMEITNQSGKITAEDVTGSARLNSKYGSIRVNSVSGKVFVSNRSGSIDIEDAGSLFAENENGSIKASRIRGSEAGSISNRNGSIELLKVNGDLAIDQRNGSVETSDGKGSLKVKNQNGSIRINRHQGNLELDSDNGEFILQSISAETAILRSRNRPIEAEFLSIKRLEINAESADVRIELPSRPDGSVDIRVEEGSISGGAVDLSRIQQVGEVKSLNYSGNGNGLLQVRLRDGSLIVRQRAL